MILFLSPVEVDESALPSGVEQAKQNRLTVDFITSMRATVVSLGMYPPGSATIAQAVEKVSDQLQNVLESQPETTLSEVSGRLLVDDRQLDERDRKKAPVVDFLTSMIERKIQSITFKARATADELVDFLYIMSRKPDELKESVLTDLLEEKGINNIQLNERIFVATSAAEQEEAKAREMLLSKLLADEDVDLGDENLDTLLGDKEKFSAALRSMVAGKDDDKLKNQDRAKFVEVKTKQVKNMLFNSARAVETITDPEQRMIFIESLADLIAELDGDMIFRIFYEEKLSPTQITELGLEAMVFETIDEVRVVGYTQSLVEEVRTIKSSTKQMEKEELLERVNVLKQMMKDLIHVTMKQPYFKKITELLKLAGLVKETVAKKLEEQAEEAQLQAEAEGKMTSVAVNFIRGDGSVDETSLERAIDNFEKFKPNQIPGVVEGLNEIIGEVVFNERIGVLVTKMVERLDAEADYSPIYISIANFLEKLSKELTFNEDYDNAVNILKVFGSHADTEVERHHEQKKHAVRAIDAIASEEVNRMLLTVYQHGEDDMKEAVSELIILLGQRMLTALLDLLKTSDDRRIRRHIIELMKRMGKQVLDAIRIELANAENPWYVIRNLVIILADLGTEDHAEWIQPQISHPEARVRKEVIKALATLDAQGSVELIRSTLLDKDLSVRSYGISTLGTLKDVESIEDIAVFISKRNIAQMEEEERLQLDAVSALSKMGDESVVPFLLDALKKEGIFSKNRTKSPQIRARAVWALASYPSAAVTKAIRAAAKDSNDAVKEAAQAVLPRLQ